MKKLYGVLPPDDPGRIVWAGNFSQKIAFHGPALGLSPAEIQAAQKDMIFYQWLLQVWAPAVANLAQSAASYKVKALKGEGELGMVPALPAFADAPEPVPGGLWARLAALILQIKAAPAYNEHTIGRELRLLRAPVASSTVVREYPTFTLTIIQGKNWKIVRIDFKKYGHDGVEIECRINGGAWEFLAIDNAKPHFDERPLLVAAVPETREYRLRFWDKGEANGIYSPGQSISVTV